MEATHRLKAPEPSSHPVDVGLRTEAAILAELVQRGYQVLVPFGVNQRYDLVLDIEGEFVRAQCKTGRLRDGVIRFQYVQRQIEYPQDVLSGLLGRCGRIPRLLP